MPVTITNPTLRVVSGIVLALATGAGGCSNAVEGGVSGAGIGALSGLAIGSLSGDAGKGAAIGAVVGGVGGAVIGDQNRRKDEAAAAAAKNPPPSQAVVVYGQPQNYSTGRALGRFVGKWRVSGMIDGDKEAPLVVSGSANGAADKTYFVRLDLRFTDPRNGQQVEGTSILSQTGGRGIEMTTSFSTSPRGGRLRGELANSGSLCTLTETWSQASGRRIVIRMSSASEWTAEVWR